MATLFTNPFTYANGTAWTAAGFTLLEGSSVGAPTVQGNKGYGPSVAALRVLRSSYFPGVTNYAAQARAYWGNAGGTGRVASIGVRVGASSGYWLEVDSDFGTGRARLRKRVAGVYSNLGGSWSAIGAQGSAANLNAGQTLRLEVKNEASQVRLIAYVGSTKVREEVDTAADRIEGGGGIGLKFDAISTLGDVSWDDLTAEDFASTTAAASDIGTGLVLVLNGEYLDAQQQRDLGVSIVRVRKSHDMKASVALRDNRRFHNPALVGGMDVQVYLDGTCLAAGILRGTDSTLEGSEGTTYEVTTLKELASEVSISDPRTNEVTATFNVPTDNPQYDRTRAGKTLADIITWVVVNHGEGEGGLRDVGAAAPSGDIIASGALAGLDYKIPAVTISGNVASAVESLLRFAPGRAWNIDPATRQWSFPTRSTGTKRNLDLGTSHVTGALKMDPSKNYTRVKFVGENRPALTTLKRSDGTLTRGWPTDLGNAWTLPKSFRHQLVVTLTAIGVDGNGRLTLTVQTPDALILNEWQDGTVNVPAAGTEAYSVESNTAGTTATVVLNETAWLSGPPALPVNILLGNGRMGDVHKLFDLPADKAVADVPCLQARIVNQDPTTSATAYQVTNVNAALVSTENEDGSTTHQVKLATPAVKPLSLINTADTQDPCAAGGSEESLDVEVDVPLVDVDATTRRVKKPTLLVPTSGYRGSAFTRSSSKWNGGGKPGYGDLGLKRTLEVPDPNYNGSDEAGEYTAFADKLLEVYGTLAMQGSFRIADTLSVDWADITQRVTLSDSGGRTTGYETADDLWVMAVEWLPQEKATVVYVGTLAAVGAYDIEAMRLVFTDSTKSDELRRTQEQMLRMLECMRGQMAGGDNAGAPSPNPIPDCMVSSAGRPLSEGATATEEEEDCPVGGFHAVACDLFPCGTVTNPAAFQANADALSNTAVKGMQLKPSELGAALGVVDAICCLYDSLAANWAALGGIASAHDQELYKANQDLGNIRVQTVALKDCVNNGFTYLCGKVEELEACIDAIVNWLNNVQKLCLVATFGACFAGPGVPYACDDAPACDVTCAPTACTWSFTETVCDPTACLVTVDEVVCAP